MAKSPLDLRVSRWHKQRSANPFIKTYLSQINMQLVKLSYISQQIGPDESRRDLLFIHHL